MLMLKNVYFWLFGWPINNPTGSIYPLTYINLHNIWKQSVKDLLSYGDNDEESADAVAQPNHRTLPPPPPPHVHLYRDTT